MRVYRGGTGAKQAKQGIHRFRRQCRREEGLAAVEAPVRESLLPFGGKTKSLAAHP